MDSIGGNRRNSGKSPPGQAPLYNQTLLANIFQRHSHYETSHFARNSAIFRIFQQCPVCACYDISGAVYLFVAGESINGPRVFNSKRAFVHDTWQCTQRRCILCVQLLTQDARDPDWFSNQGNLCVRLLSPRVNAPLERGGCVLFLSNRVYVH